MVRLKVLPAGIGPGPDYFFNSNMVRLKGTKAPLQEAHISFFNSNMVRLKADVVNNDDTMVNFQFQHGTIKSIIVYKIIIVVRLFSIPTWYD